MPKLPKVKLQLHGEFSAPDLEEIIGDISRARASLEPAVSPQPPSEWSEREVLVQTDPRFDIRTLANAGVRLWLRNEGIGWLAFELSATDKAGFIEFLGKQIGHTHTAH